MTINIEVKNYIYIISSDKINNYKETIDAADALLKKMDRVDVKNIKNKDVQIEINNCITSSDELLEKIGSLIEKHSCN